jgi:nucleoside-diphosphate-sugar epimerase
MSKILLIGSSGYVGSKLTELLDKDKIDYHNIDSFWFTKRDFKSI